MFNLCEKLDQKNLTDLEKEISNLQTTYNEVSKKLSDLKQNLSAAYREKYNTLSIEMSEVQNKISDLEDGYLSDEENALNNLDNSNFESSMDTFDKEEAQKYVPNIGTLKLKLKNISNDIDSFS